MRFYQCALIVACVLLIRSAGDVSADWPQGSGSATSTASSGGGATRSVENIRFGAPPASSAASAPVVSLYPSGTTAICRDSTSSMATDATSACDGHGGLFDWLGAGPATELSGAVPAHSSPQQLDSTANAVAGLQPDSSLFTSQLGSLTSQAGSAVPVSAPRALSVQAPVSVQAPSLALPRQGEPLSVQGPSGGFPSSPTPSSATPPPAAEPAAETPAESASPAEMTPPSSSETPASTETAVPPSEMAPAAGPDQQVTLEAPAPEPPAATEAGNPGEVAANPAPASPNPAEAATGGTAAASSPDVDAPPSPDSPRMAACNDGTDSYNPDQSVACSQHGGIREWFGPTP